MAEGIGLANGSYIWIAESDDWAEPDFLEKTISIFQKDNELGLVYCNSKMIVNEKFETTLSEIKIKILNNKKWESNYVHDGKFEIIDSLSLCCSINNASAVVFNKKILLESLPFDKEFTFIGDWIAI